MQILGLHKSIYTLSSYSLSQEKLEEFRKKYEPDVKRWELLRAQEMTYKVCQDATGICRATYYRYKKRLKDLSNGILPPSRRPKNLRKPRWGQPEMQLVLRIRRENPTYGKEKIAIILRRDHGQTLSESTVGRILTHLKKKGLITKSPSALRTKRRRVFKKHARPWSFEDYNTLQLGERVQIDHMTVTKNGVTLKHFQAWERRSKYIHAAVFSNAKASSAKRFLLNLIDKAPFTIKSIQVDGGSEFMAQFEDACAERHIPLIVLPPNKPQYNGGVERGNRTFREEFYALPSLLEDSVRGIQAALSKAVLKYNSYRPHRGLKGLTPFQYILSTYPESPLLSHMY